MKLKDLMTRSPVCCTPDDTVTRAAQIMRNEDVGPVPVVSDHRERHLVGILTDRDLAIKVVADGRDPNSTRVQSVMSRALVTAHPHDDVQEALYRMSANQVRRLPVIDQNGCLLGIVAQADLARCVDSEDVGEMVGEVSEATRTSMRPKLANRGERWMPQSTFVNRRPPDYDDYDSRSSDVSSALIGVACMAAGAALMYLLDPDRGTDRRGMIRDKASQLYSSAEETVSQTARDVGDRASDFVDEAKSRFGSTRESQRFEDVTRH